VKGFIFSAGYGRRLAPFTDITPKPLMPILNTPAIVYNIALLASMGIKEIGINLCHLGSQIRDYLGNGEDFGVRFYYSQEPEMLGTGGGIKHAEMFFDETTIILNGDVLIDLRIHELLAAHKKTSAIATMVLRHDAEQEKFGTLGINEKQKVVRILEQQTSEDEIKSYMFCGAQIIEPEFLNYLPEKKISCIVRDGYQIMLQEAEGLYAFIHQGCWADTGTPERYLDIQQKLLDQREELFFLDDLPPKLKRLFVDTKALTTPSLISAECQVSDEAMVESGAIIGPDVKIDAGAQIQRSILLEGARIEANQQIKNAIVDAYHCISVSQ